MIRETQKKWLSSKSLLCCVRGLSVGQRTSAAVRSATVTRHSWSAGWRWTNCTVCLFQTVCVQRRKLNLQRVVDNELVPIILIMESFFLRELWNLCWYQLLRCKGLTHQATSQRQDRLWASAALVVAVCPAHVSDNQCLERALERPCSVLWKLLSGTHFLDLACCVAHTACLTETSTDSCFFYNVSLCKNIFFGCRASRDVVIPQFGQYWSLLSCLALSRGARCCTAGSSQPLSAAFWPTEQEELAVEPVCERNPSDRLSNQANQSKRTESAKAKQSLCASGRRSMISLVLSGRSLHFTSASLPGPFATPYHIFLISSSYISKSGVKMIANATLSWRLYIRSHDRLPPPVGMEGYFLSCSCRMYELGCRAAGFVVRSSAATQVTYCTATQQLTYIPSSSLFGLVCVTGRDFLLFSDIYESK